MQVDAKYTYGETVTGEVDVEVEWVKIEWKYNWKKKKQEKKEKITKMDEFTINPSSSRNLPSKGIVLKLKLTASNVQLKI